MKASKQKRPPGLNQPWVPSWKHLTPQGLVEFGERQAARLKAVGKQRRVKV
jgi:hypothetical protein